MKNHDARFFELLPDVLPCVYCRSSFAQFYTTLKVHQKNGWEYFVYRAHARVTLKLYTQDVDANKDLSKWKNYTPAFKDIPVLSEAAWSESMCMFLYYVQYDWEPKTVDKPRDLKNIRRWMDTLAKMLATSNVSFGSEWFRVWGRYRKDYMNLGIKDRIKVIRALQHTTPSRTKPLHVITRVCKKGVVGCG